MGAGIVKKVYFIVLFLSVALSRMFSCPRGVIGLFPDVRYDWCDSIKGLYAWS